MIEKKYVLETSAWIFLHGIDKKNFLHIHVESEQ